MEFILCRDLSEQEKMNFLADVIDEEKKNELNTITVRLHRDINGKVDPEGIEVETSITPVEILDILGFFSGSTKEVEITFYTSFIEKLRENIRSSGLFDADGEMVIRKKDGKQAVWPCVIRNLKVLISSEVREDELFIELAQIKDRSGNQYKRLTARCSLEDLVFKVISA